MTDINIKQRYYSKQLGENLGQIKITDTSFGYVSYYYLLMPNIKDQRLEKEQFLTFFSKMNAPDFEE